MKKSIKKITKVPKGYSWYGTTRLSKNRIENEFVLIVTNKKK